MVPKQGFHNNAIKEPRWVPQRIGPLGSNSWVPFTVNRILMIKINFCTVEMSHGY